MIEARNVHKRYPSGGGWLEVLKGVSLSIDAGECVAITGPSGAGKSTLLHLLAGLDVPTTGEVLWEGRPLTAMRDGERARLRNRMIGFVFQLYHLLPELSALENVMLPGLMSASPPRLACSAGRGGGSAFGGNGRQRRRELQARAHASLERVGVSHRAAHRPSQLSGGEMQRVAIARALINEPKIVFCDEPTGNLDSETGRKIAELLMALPQQQHVALVLVTHERELAARADRHIELHDGQIATRSMSR